MYQLIFSPVEIFYFNRCTVVCSEALSRYCTCFHRNRATKIHASQKPRCRPRGVSAARLSTDARAISNPGDPERVTVSILRLTICESAGAWIRAPNGKTTPHRFARARFHQRGSSPLCRPYRRDALGADTGPERASERAFVRNLAVLLFSLQWSKRLFALPSLLIRARATSAVTGTRLTQGAPSPRVALPRFFPLRRCTDRPGGSNAS